MALEVNSNPIRLDLNAEHVRRALKFGVKLMINSDAHNVAQLDNIVLGVGQARRGWASKDDVINTLPLKKFEKLLRK